jgi:hypothetical protein
MLGLRMAENGDCEANFIVAFVADGQAFLSQIEDRSSYVFAEMTREERGALMAEPGPRAVMLRCGRARATACRSRAART